MSLFDDILRKPQETIPVDPLTGSGFSGTKGGNPPTDDGTTSGKPLIAIRKTEETSLFTTNESSINKGESMVITPQNPLAHAEEGSNIMLIPSVERVEEPVLAGSQAQVSPIRENITPPANDKIFSFGNSEMRSVSLDSVDIAQEGIESETFEKSIAETQKEVNKMIHPKEFIEKSIADIDVMIGDINTARDSKIIEAEEYGEEKDRIAALEKDAYTEATTLDEEKSHALHVRELLSGELTRGIGTLYAPSAPANPVPMTPVSEIADALFGLIEAPADREMETPSILESTGVQSGSVETTMTELAVQNTVTATIEPRTKEIGKEEESPHTQKPKKKEEVALV